MFKLKTESKSSDYVIFFVLIKTESSVLICEKIEDIVHISGHMPFISLQKMVNLFNTTI